MAPRKYLIEVEKAKEAKDGKPSIGPVYRSLFAKDGFPPPVPGLESCWDVFRMSVEKYPNNPMLGRREIVNGKAGKYVWQTYKQVYDVVIKVGNSIRSCGVEPGAKCGIYGANCAEWIMSMEACNAHGLYCVPLYDTLGASAVEFIICHSEVSIAFVEENKICELLKTFPNSTQYLKTIVSFGKVALKEQEEIERSGLAVYSWDEFLKLGENKQYELPVKKKEDICTIMYTSGTTGDPKGVLISNDSIVTLIAGVKRLLESVKESLTSEDVYLSYLPLAHIFDRVIEELFIQHGASIGFWRGDVKLLIEDIGELKPTIFCAVPRVLERVYSGLQQKVSTGGFLKKTLFNVAYSHKFSSMKKGLAHHQASPICDKIVFNKVRQGLGGKVRLILSGAAPLSNHVEAFLRVVSCAHVLQGYGLTETCAGTFVSLPNELPMLGTVGPPVPNVDVCLESVPEMGYDALSSTPRGEICIRGKTLFAGYYKREDLTEEVLKDGWFHTGDIGEWQPDGSMKIIDRKKNIFKLSQGEYVAVENLENIYSLVSDIDSIWVYGNSFESFLVAVANPNQQALEHWAQEHGMSGDFKSLCENPKAKEYMLGELTKIGKEKKLKGFEFIKAIHLDPEPFDMERDLITPTYKKKRPQLLKYYQNVIDSMYKSASKPSA
ncbi:long chain acyl-CoA synthetase 4 [Populus alba]|uniref:Long-chain-fatty-acid--CoA ligase n=2 Tax=Populus TaxID=3689 RepID=A0A4U5N844_POPAL|nr:long chain acyl-CoA synthetase 4-like [Populus alba]KAJ7004236.1 long chain acyl-CoA synthetase 4-like [Populus alba x Populus x berolinensis]TKR79046.1 acyl-coA synthetase family protein [Populus alba]